MGWAHPRKESATRQEVAYWSSYLNINFERNINNIGLPSPASGQLNRSLNYLVVRQAQKAGRGRADQTASPAKPRSVVSNFVPYMYHIHCTSAAFS